MGKQAHFVNLIWAIFVVILLKKPTLSVIFGLFEPKFDWWLFKRAHFISWTIVISFLSAERRRYHKLSLDCFSPVTADIMLLLRCSRRPATKPPLPSLYAADSSDDLSRFYSVLSRWELLRNYNLFIREPALSELNRPVHLVLIWRLFVLFL